MRVFRGWIVVGAASALLFVVWGVAYSFAAFFPALEHEFAATRARTSLVFSVAGFIYFGIGGLSGIIADRFGPQRVILAGVIAMTAALALASAVGVLWQIYVLYGLGLGLGIGFAYVPALGAVQSWFSIRRGLASGITVSGIGVATMISPPLVDSLIGKVGWRGAYLVLALVTAIVGGAAALLIGKNPATRKSRMPTIPAVGSDVRAAIATPAFRRLYLSALLVSFGMSLPFVHLEEYARDAGHDTAAIWLVGAIGVGNLGGRFLIGSISDRLGRRRAMMFCFFGIAAMMFLWSVSSNLGALAVFAVGFGTSYGGFVALAPAIAADHFSGRSLTTVIGVYYSAIAIGTLLGPTLAGYAFDVFGSYQMPLLCSALLTLAAAIVVRGLPSPAPVPDEQTSSSSPEEDG